MVKGRKDVDVIDDDSRYSGDEIDEEEDESIDSEDGDGKSGADIHYESLALDKSSSDGNDDSEDGRMERFELDIAKTHAVAERFRKESNLSAQQGADEGSE